VGSKAGRGPTRSFLAFPAGNGREPTLLRHYRTLQRDADHPGLVVRALSGQRFSGLRGDPGHISAAYLTPIKVSRQLGIRLCLCFAENTQITEDRMSIPGSPTRGLLSLSAMVVLCSLTNWPSPVYAEEEIDAPPFIPHGIVLPQAEATTPPAESAQPAVEPQTPSTTQPEAVAPEEESATPPAETAQPAVEPQTPSATQPEAVAPEEESATPPAETAQQADTVPPAEPEAQSEAVTPPAEAPGKKASSTANDTLHNYRSGYRARIDQQREQREARLKAMRENREHWRSLRRWWNNPAAEQRRQWNKARSQYYRDMARERSRYYDQYREWR